MERIVRMNDKGCYLTLAHDVGNTVKFVLDDGKKHQGKIVKIHVTMTEDYTRVSYEVRTTFRGKRDYAVIDSEKVVQ